MLKVIWFFTLTVAATAALPPVTVAQGECEAMPAGPKRTDCFILRARVQGLKSDIAAGTARQKKGAAKLESQTGSASDPTHPGKPPAE
jgi:hypothetical protein